MHIRHIDAQEPKRYAKTALDLIGHENMAKLRSVGLMVVSRSEYWWMVARLAETPEDKAYYEHVAMHDHFLSPSERSSLNASAKPETFIMTDEERAFVYDGLPDDESLEGG